MKGLQRYQRSKLEVKNWVPKGSKGSQRVPKGRRGIQRITKDSKGFQRLSKGKIVKCSKWFQITHKHRIFCSNSACQLKKLMPQRLLGRLKRTMNLWKISRFKDNIFQSLMQQVFVRKGLWLYLLDSSCTLGK